MTTLEPCYPQGGVKVYKEKEVSKEFAESVRAAIDKFGTFDFGALMDERDGEAEKSKSPRDRHTTEGAES
jgi:hypothetical protein